MVQTPLFFGYTLAIWLLISAFPSQNLLLAAIAIFALVAIAGSNWSLSQAKVRPRRSKFARELAIWGAIMLLLPLLLQQPVGRDNLVPILLFVGLLFFVTLSQKNATFGQVVAACYPSATGFYVALMAVLMGLGSVAQGWEVPSAAESAHLVWIGVLFGLIQVLLIESTRCDGPTKFRFETGFLSAAIFVQFSYFGETPSNNVLFASPLIFTSIILMLGHWHLRRTRY